MKNETLKIYLETTHKNYLNMANEALRCVDNEPIENKVMRDFFLKKATQYTSKAEAILKVIEFISEEDKKEREVKKITDKFG